MDKYIELATWASKSGWTFLGLDKNKRLTLFKFIGNKTCFIKLYKKTWRLYYYDYFEEKTTWRKINKYLQTALNKKIHSCTWWNDPKYQQYGSSCKHYQQAGNRWLYFESQSQSKIFDYETFGEGYNFNERRKTKPLTKQEAQFLLEYAVSQFKNGMITKEDYRQKKYVFKSILKSILKEK